MIVTSKTGMSIRFNVFRATLSDKAGDSLLSSKFHFLQVSCVNRTDCLFKKLHRKESDSVRFGDRLAVGLHVEQLSEIIQSSKRFTRLSGYAERRNPVKLFDSGRVSYQTTVPVPEILSPAHILLSYLIRSCRGTYC
jgi:hypothetical protein